MIDVGSGRDNPAGFRDNLPMRQLQLFTPAELAGMRDRTASRSYSPAADEFRRIHERHRRWGLARRHAERLRRAEKTRPVTAAAQPRPSTTGHPGRSTSRSWNSGSGRRCRSIAGTKCSR